MFFLRAEVVDGVFRTVTDQAEESLILETNRELQKCDPVPDMAGLGRWALSIPMLEWVNLRTKYPDLACPDMQIRSRAFLHFMRSDESVPYRVRGRI
jgi:hypothetical protein